MIEAREDCYGLITIGVRGGSLVAPAAGGAVGERRRIRVIAGDVSLTHGAPAPSSILNVLPARIRMPSRLNDEKPGSSAVMVSVPGGRFCSR